MEARLVTPARRNVTFAGFVPEAPLSKARLTTVSLNGDAMLLVKAVLYSDADCETVVTVYLDGKSVADAQVRLRAGADCSELLMGAANLAGEGIVVLDCDTAGVVLRRAEVGLIGDGAALAREASDFRFARGYAHAAAAVAASNIITVYPVDGGIGTGVELCRGNTFDICATPDGYALINCDLAGNLWLRKLDAALVPRAVSLLGRGGESPTVYYAEGALTAAAVYDGRIRVFNAAENAVQYEVPFNGRVDGAAFVKNAPRPTLAVTSGGKIYLKTSSDVRLGRENISVMPMIRAVSDWGDEYTWK